MYISQLISRRQSPSEILQEYERLRKEEEERRLRISTNPETSVEMNIDATELFENYSIGRFSRDEYVIKIFYIQRS